MKILRRLCSSLHKIRALIQLQVVIKLKRRGFNGANNANDIDILGHVFSSRVIRERTRAGTLPRASVRHRWGPAFLAGKPRKRFVPEESNLKVRS